jgi:hypothetical protein
MKTINQVEAMLKIVKMVKEGYTLAVATLAVNNSYKVDGGIEGAVRMVEANKVWNSRK